MKINSPLVKGKVKEVFPKIYCVLVDDNYDRAMLFCRYQEFYESPSKKFRGKYFSWSQYMRFYKDHWKKDTFTYPIDWSGYNIPSSSLDKSVCKFESETEYDELMMKIYINCLLDTEAKTDNSNFYLIGASSKDLKTLDHEIAHGLYYTNREYRMRMLYQLSLIPKKTMDKIDTKLIKMGYVNDRKILDDEAQAFLSTGLYNGLDINEIKKYEKNFISIFKNFTKNN